MSDPYKILGLTKGANLEEIKKSYRKLAKKYHPDLNPGNKEAEKHFKEVSHAFDLIGTAEARAKFDRGGTEEQQRQHYEDFMKGFGNKQSYHDTQRDHGRYSYSFGEDFGGADFFENLFGGRGGAMEFPGEDLNYTLDVDFKEAALGAEKIITLPSGKNLSVKIPAGIESGKKLRFKGQGNPGTGKAGPGDAYIEIHVRDLDGFRRKGKDIETDLPISFLEAITGADVELQTLEGKIVLKIPPGVSSGSKLKVKGKGAGALDARGDLYVVLKIVMPKNIDPALKNAVESLKGQFDYNPRMQ